MYNGEFKRDRGTRGSVAKRSANSRPPPGFRAHVKWGISKVWEALVNAAVKAITRDGTKAMGRLMHAFAIGGSLLLIAICILIVHLLGLPLPKLSSGNLKAGGAISAAGLSIRALRKPK